MKKGPSKEGTKMKKLLILSLATLMAIPMSGCNKNEWDITRESYEHAINVESVLSGTEEEMKFVLDTEIKPFTSNFSKDDVILYNLDTLAKIKNKDYYTYKSYTNSKVTIKNFEKYSDGTGFTLDFDGDPNTHYGVIVNKKAIAYDQYLIATASKSFAESRILLGGKSDEEERNEWNSRYIKHNATYDDVTNMLEIGKYFGEIFFGAISNCPTSCVDGVFGIISMFSGLASNEPETYDLFNKLIDIERKLTEISDQINKNTRVLMEEDMYIETQVDKALIEIYKQNYQNYITNYVEPLDNIQRDYEQFHEARLAQLANKEVTTPISLHYEVVDGKYALISQSESKYNAQGTVIYNVEIPSYANAKKFLADHNQTVTTGFMDAFYDDLENAVDNAVNNEVIEVNSSITKTDYKNHLYKSILDSLEKERYEGAYGSDEFTKAQTLLNATINLGKNIAGTYGTDSILESMIQRIRCMYNFHKEGKMIIRSFIANVKETFEKYAALSSSACSYAKINQAELGKVYEEAIDTIQAYDKVNDETPENYSYILKQPMTTNFIKSIFDVSYTNPGNHCVFHKEYTWRKVEGFNIFKGPTLTKLDIDNIYLVDESSHLKINARRKVMATMGLTVKADYNEYLSESGNAGETAYNMWTEMHQAGWVGNDGNRFLAEFNGIKELDEGENITFRCVASGNPDGDYFNVGTNYKYQGHQKAEKWYGAKAVGKFLDATNLTNQSNNVISAYARYDEAHTLWLNDEYYAFQSNPYGNYMFISYLG